MGDVVGTASKLLPIDLCSIKLICLTSLRAEADANARSSSMIFILQVIMSIVSFEDGMRWVGRCIQMQLICKIKQVVWKRLGAYERYELAELSLDKRAFLKPC